MKKQTTNHKKRSKLTLFILLFLVTCILSVGFFLWIKSPGKPEQFLNSQGQPLEGAVSEKIFINIGGVKQGMFIRSKNTSNPVLLYLHGGPSFPNYFLIEKYNPGLEEHFTVCYWEQRGGGLSYTPEVSRESMTLEQLSEDAIEVTHYLRDRFGKEKIYLMAHSGGTLVGLLSANKAPELFHAYIAMAQITHQLVSEKIAYKYMLEQYQLQGNKKAVEKLRSYQVLESDSNVLDFYGSVARDKYMHELGIGTMHQMNSIFRDIFIPVWTCRAYTLREKINIWKSKFSFLPKTNLRKETLENDFTQSVPSLDIPVFFLHGKYDLTVNIDLAREYFTRLDAPHKGFYSFENSAHSPLYEEPEKVREILKQDVLQNKVELKD